MITNIMCTWREIFTEGAVPCILIGFFVISSPILISVSIISILIRPRRTVLLPSPERWVTVFQPEAAKVGVLLDAQ